MNEKLVFKKSFFIFLIGFIVFSIIGLMMKSISYSLGFLLGYLFNLAIFYVIIITSINAKTRNTSVRRGLVSNILSKYKPNMTPAIKVPNILPDNVNA